MGVTWIVELALAPVLVGAASLAAARWDARIGGTVSAFPAIVGPVLLIAVDRHGPGFAAGLANGTLLGLASLSAFVLLYGCTAARLAWPSCLALGWIGAGIAAALVRHVSAGSPVGLIVAVGSISLARRWLPASPGSISRPAMPRWELPARLAAATVLVAAVTAAADRLGPLAGGICAALPVLAAVLAVATHRLDGPAAALGLLDGMLVGLTGFVVFCQLVAALAVPAGPAAAFALATVAAVAVQVTVARGQVTSTSPPRSGTTTRRLRLARSGSGRTGRRSRALASRMISRSSSSANAAPAQRRTPPP
jgi:hypothetical protein